MRALNYIELRLMVKNKTFSIDLNKNVFNHPLYSHIDIVKLDFDIKNRAFNEYFLQVSDFVYNSKYNSILEENTRLKAHVIFSPRKEFIDVRSSKNIFNKTLNYFRHRESVVIRPYQIVAIPLMINIIENTTLPNLKFNLTDEYNNTGLKVINITSSENENDETYITVCNTSSKNIRIKDLSYIGDIRILI